MGRLLLRSAGKALVELQVESQRMGDPADCARDQAAPGNDGLLMNIHREAAKKRSCAKKFNSYFFFANLRFFAASR
jgi:hypothetical protein